MNTDTLTDAKLPTWEDFLATWKDAGSPESLPGRRDGFYLGRFPVVCCNHARIDRESLPESVRANIPNKHGIGCHPDANVSPSWTKDHGTVLQVSFSCYQNGWNQMGVSVWLPKQDKWVHPTEVFTYGYGD